MIGSSSNCALAGSETRAAVFCPSAVESFSVEERVSACTICRGIHAPLRDGGLGLTLQVLERRAMQRCAQERMDWIRRIDLGDFEHKNVLVIDERVK